ncbi:ATP-binding protein [Candidatus Nomurabacteria bacterium]|nr:ATP-binding protein [Candidatus Nomurabacteria bacterium]
MSKEIKHIGIRPGVSVLSVLKHLNYKPWYAIGEFVDNAIQSYLQHKSELKKLEGANFKLKIEIDLVNNGKSQNIIIRDNAAGIFSNEYARAFKMAEVPQDSSGLSEFGMGMKSASCWFSNQWQIRSTAIGEEVERTIKFNISKIIKDKEEELPIKNNTKNSKAHYTEVTLFDINNKIAGKTMGKIKDHLSSMYREFIRGGEVEIYFNNEKLTFHDPKILEAPFYKEEKGVDRIWHKPIDFEIRKGVRISGFAALRESGSRHDAGFAIFRRRRLIIGGRDATYRPQEIFGDLNSFPYQRLFGELHVEGVGVSHTKDGLQWQGDDEEEFVKMLRKAVTALPMNLLQQAQNFRSKKNPKDALDMVAPYVESTAKIIEQHMTGEMSGLRDKDSYNKTVDELPHASNSFTKTINLEFKDIDWEIDLQCSADPALNDWMEVGDHLLEPDKKNKKTKKRIRRVGIRVSLQNDFMLNFFSNNEGQEGLIRVVAAIGLAEVLARDSGVKYSATVRNNINDLLRGSLSKLQ